MNLFTSTSVGGGGVGSAVDIDCPNRELSRDFLLAVSVDLLLLLSILMMLPIISREKDVNFVVRGCFVLVQRYLVLFLWRSRCVCSSVVVNVIL